MKAISPTLDRSRGARIRAAAALSGAIVGMALSGAGSAGAQSVGAGGSGTLDLALYAGLLDEYTQATDDTVGTRVDYAGLRGDPRWGRLVESLEETRPSRLRSRAEQLAYWINAYNILAIGTVVEHYPLESIRDVGSFFSPVWKQEAARIEGKTVTLHRIEHEILRPMGEPRIHAAIVCASTSCPSLARTPFTAEDLDAQLDATTRRWLGVTTKGVRLDRDAGRVVISKIFDWFEKDFAAAGGVRRFIATHLPEADSAWLAEAGLDADVDYFDYDWSLNDWQRAR